MSSPASLQSPSPCSSPPNTQNGASPQQLTPRSKVKAMLAAIDDESDSDTSPKVSKFDAKFAISTLAKKGDANGSPRQGRFESEDDAEDEDSDVARVKPRGKLAARLQSHDTVKDDLNVDKEHAGAYERIRMQLLSGPSKAYGTLSPSRSTHGSNDKDEPLNSAPRRTARVAIDSDNSISTPKRSVASHRSPSGLSLSQKPASPPKTNGEQYGSDGSDSDLPPNPQVTSKVLQLVARKKAEREAKEAQEARNKSRPHQRPHSKKSSLPSQPPSSGVSEDDIEDIETERRLTQHNQPTRKASKKALEEMNRETQRMSRNMQLAHQAKTKKKISKESLFARFNFKTSSSSTKSAIQALSSSTAPSSTPVSEFESHREVDSPSSGPPQSTWDTEANLGFTKLPELNQLTVMDALNFGAGQPLTESIAHTKDVEDELPTIFEIVNPLENPLDKGKGKAVDEQIYEAPPGQDPEKPRKPNQAEAKIQLRPQHPHRINNDERDSDSDLEILPKTLAKTSKPDIFDRVPATKPSEGRSLQALRALAHLTSPSKQDSRSKASMSLSEMQASLQRRARQQAALERAEKIQDLKDRGISVQTAEEREKDQVEVEDLVEKARREAEEIMQKEKNAARKGKKENGEDHGLPDTSDEDEDYQDNEADESNIELSGSEEEELAEEDQADYSEMEVEVAEEEAAGEGRVSVTKDRSALENFINTEASEACNEEEEEEARTPADVEDNDDELDNLPLQRRRRTNHIVEDEDDEEKDGAGKASPEMVTPVQNPLIPGQGMSDGPSIGIMGMTQAFAATMAESQTQAKGEDFNEDQEQDSLCFLGPIPDPNFPVFDLNESQPLVPDSQNGDQQEHTVAPPGDIELHFSQSQSLDVAMEDTQDLPPTATQYSEIPDPTQDVGFALSSPGPEQRFVSVPPSTVDTVVLSRATGQETPKAIRKGRLRRRIIPSADELDVTKLDGVNETEDAGFQTSVNAFDVLKKSKGKAASPINSFDKKKSEAKDMVEDQAQESEDEYAGLGGASDDESGGSEDEEVRKMIEEGEVNVNEGELAAFYADKERATDEKAVEKLFKDINNGLLRRKRGAEFDLSDSEDDAEARHRAKRREFARMRKALLENENVGKIAEDPKKLAFLRAIEDRDDDENFAFLDNEHVAEGSSQQLPDTQPQEFVPNSQVSPSPPDAHLGKRKRPALEPSTFNSRLPPAARRTKPSKKLSTLAEIRESVSLLIEDSNIAPLAPLDSSDIEEERAAANPRRATTDRSHIIDRISLARASSLSSSTTTNGGGRLAFQAPASNTLGFKVPSLLRRATIASSSLNGNEDRHGISTNTAATERAAGGERGEFVRKGNGKRSSVMSFAREAERRQVLDRVEKRRAGERDRIRGGVRGLGALVAESSWD